MPATPRATKKATRPANVAKGIVAKSEEARFQAWLKDFDARHADLALRLDTLLSKLGVDRERESA